MYKKVLMMIWAILVVTVVPNAEVNAELYVETEQKENEDIVSEYLMLLSNGRVSEAYSIMEDERVSVNKDVAVMNLEENELQQLEYVQSGSEFEDMYNEEPIDRFSILYTIDNKVITRLYFEDGTERTVPFEVQENNGERTVIISLDDISQYGEIELENTEIIAPGDQITPKSSAVETLVDTYSFSYLFGTIYGLNTFNLSSNIVKISGYQVNDAYDSGYTEPVQVVYAIVNKHWYGDDLWGQSGVVNLNGNFNISITGNSSNASGVQIRITNKTGAYPRSAGNGKVYQINL